MLPFFPSTKRGQIIYVVGICVAFVAAVALGVGLSGGLKTSIAKGEYFAIGPRAADTPVCHIYDPKLPAQPCNTFPSPIVGCKILRPWMTASECRGELQDSNTGVNTPYSGQVFYLSKSKH